MTIATSVFLITAGAILRYALTVDVSGVDLDAVGLILMIAGAVGLAFSLLWELVLQDRERDRERGSPPDDYPPDYPTRRM
jgi:hypothetical protein